MTAQDSNYRNNVYHGNYLSLAYWLAKSRWDKNQMSPGILESEQSWQATSQSEKASKATSQTKRSTNQPTNHMRPGNKPVNHNIIF